MTPRSRSNNFFLVNASPPKLFDVATSNSVDAYGRRSYDVEGTGQYFV